MTVGIIRTGNSTGIGTGTTKTELSPAAGLFMPSDGRALLGIKPVVACITPTAGQSISTKIEVESSDVRNMTPYEVLAAPVGAGLSAGFASFTGMETWKIQAALQGGEALHVFATALVANTIAPEAMAFVIVSNDTRDLMNPLSRMMSPQLHAKLGTLTASGTTADTDVAGTKYSFSGGRAITELFGEFHPKVIVAGDMFIGEIKYTSSEFVDSIPQTLPIYPMTVGLGTSMSYLIPGVSRQAVRIPVKPGQVNIQDYLNFGGVVGTAGSFIDGVMYE